MYTTQIVWRCNSPSEQRDLQLHNEEIQKYSDKNQSIDDFTQDGLFIDFILILKSILKFETVRFLKFIMVYLMMISIYQVCILLREWYLFCEYSNTAQLRTPSMLAVKTIWRYSRVGL